MRSAPFHVPIPALTLATTAALAGCTPALQQMQPGIPNGGRAVAVAVHPTDGDRMVVASETGGLFRTVDGGVRWAQVSGASTFGFTDVLYLPDDPDVVVATARADLRIPNGGGIWRSADAGATWTQASLSPPTAECADGMAAFDVAVDPASGRVWAGTLCGLAYSDDGGLVWQYLPTAPGYGNDKVYAVLVPAADQLKILTDAGVKVSNTGGAAWSVSASGLPSSISKGVHNQIGVSPLDPTHLYWAFNHWTWDGATSSWKPNIALYRSTDDGAYWSSVIDKPGINRAPFVRVARAPESTSSNSYRIYFGDGGCVFERSTVTHGATPTIGPWTVLTVDHCDPADLGFGPDGRSPVLLASDGGLHASPDGGLTWEFTGGNGNGYAALQITEVVGQRDAADPNGDLYFGTQDNHIWASPDNGATWTKSLCCEGFFLNVWPAPLPGGETRVTGVRCGPCGNFISDPLLVSATAFPGPPDPTGNPRLLKPAHYIHSSALSGLAATVVNLTVDNGGSWTPRYGFPEPAADLSRLAGSTLDPVVFTAVKASGVTPTGEALLGIKRITGVTGSGTPVVSDVSGFGGLGTFPTMFAWYKPYGVNPRDPNHIIVPDIVDGVVKVTKDGGGHWEPDTVLTRLVTESGALRFRDRQFTQITTFGFDPDCAGHILVGTRQAGIVRSFDAGGTWERVSGSTAIPYVSSFSFPGDGRVVASSYGRGLWSLDYTCPAPRFSLPPTDMMLQEPLIYWRGARIPISQLKNPDACPVCLFALVRGGWITDYRIDPDQGRITEVVISGGEVRAYGWDRQPVELPFRVVLGQEPGRFAGDDELAGLLEAGSVRARGLLMDGGFPRGVVLAETEVAPTMIPARGPETARIEVNVPSMGGVPVGELGTLVIGGSGFEPGLPIEVLLDGVVVQPEDPPRVDADGTFTVRMTPRLDVGGHVILVRQRTERGVLQDAFPFNVTVRDEDVVGAGGER